MVVIRNRVGVARAVLGVVFEAHLASEEQVGGLLGLEVLGHRVHHVGLLGTVRVVLLHHVDKELFLIIHFDLGLFDKTHVILLKSRHSLLDSESMIDASSVDFVGPDGQELSWILQIHDRGGWDQVQFDEVVVDLEVHWNFFQVFCYLFISQTALAVTFYVALVHALEVIDVGAVVVDLGEALVHELLVELLHGQTEEFEEVF